MTIRVVPGVFSGRVRVPASKSHTVRRLFIAALAPGISRIENPLDSLDARSCAAACRAFGAEIAECRDTDPENPNPPDSAGTKLAACIVRGSGGFCDDPGKVPGAVRDFRRDCDATGGRSGGFRDDPGKVPGTVRDFRRDCDAAGERSRRIFIDAGNSGTTFYFAAAIAALSGRTVELSGDGQLQKRDAAPLLAALAGLGIRAESVRGDGRAPVIIRGPWKGGRVSLPCPTSQYLSAMLIAAPLAPAGVLTEIDVPLLNERPYIEMTLSYLKAHGLMTAAREDLSWFRIPGGASWKAASGTVPGDFSSAAFPALAAAVSGGTVSLSGLDPQDVQGDRFFFEILSRMGRSVTTEKNPEGTAFGLTVSGSGPLRAGSFDLNATPDLLPAVAVLAAFARGDTVLYNVAHARIKETDRIAVMAAELAKLGARCSERPDGLVIRGNGSGLKGGRVSGHGDHRVVMAFASGARGARDPVEIEGAECAAVSWPGFAEMMAGKTAGAG